LHRKRKTSESIRIVSSGNPLKREAGVILSPNFSKGEKSMANGQNGQREWKGIMFNDCSFMGKVSGDPVQSGDYWFLSLRTQFTQRDQNGSYVDIEQEVPLMVEPGGPAGVLFKGLVMDGRQICVKAHYKSWNSNGQPQHAFAVERVTLGDKPFKKDSEQMPF